VVLDGAGWHRSKEVVVPDGIHLIPLPPYSPELAPAERLWRLSDEALANRYFKTLDELVNTLRRQCDSLTGRRDEVHGRTFFHWWPTLGHRTIY
jgi:transposase